LGCFGNYLEHSIKHYAAISGTKPSICAHTPADYIHTCHSAILLSEIQVDQFDFYGIYLLVQCLKNSPVLVPECFDDFISRDDIFNLMVWKSLRETNQRLNSLFCFQSNNWFYQIFEVINNINQALTLQTFSPAKFTLLTIFGKAKASLYSVQQT